MTTLYFTSQTNDWGFTLGAVYDDEFTTVANAIPNNRTSKIITGGDTAYYSDYYYELQECGLVSWSTGTYTIVLSVTTAPKKEFGVRFRIHRLDTVGMSVVDSSTYTASQDVSAGTGNYTYTISNFTFADGDTTDIFAIEMSYYNGDLHGDQSFAYEIYGGSSIEVPISIQRDLTTDTVTDGSIEIVDSSPYYIGEGINIKATPDFKYEIVSWSAAAISDLTDYTSNIASPTSRETYITMPVQSTMLSATFEITYYDVQVTANSTEGTAQDLTDTNPYEDTEVISIEATANPGYAFDYWTALTNDSTDTSANFTDASSATTTYTVPAGDTVITAHFVQTTYNVIMESTYGGTTSDDMNTGPYDLGYTINISASAETDFVFDHWTATGYYTETDYSANLGSTTASATTFQIPGEDTVLKGHFNYTGDLYQVTLHGNITSAPEGVEHRGFMLSYYPHEVPTTIPSESDYEIIVDETGTFTTGQYALIATNLYGNTTFYVRAFASRFTDMYALYDYSEEISFITILGNASEIHVYVSTEGSGRVTVDNRFLIFRGKLR